MIHLINRQCNFSKISVGKKRPEGFSKEKCFANLQSVFNSDDVNCHVVFDGDPSKFELPNSWKLHKTNSGSGAKSFIDSLEYALSISKEDEIIYFVEDDYLHKSNALAVIYDGMFVNKEGYISLYDHYDKYTPVYSKLDSKIILGQTAHWRTTPSTTDTFAIRRHTLEKHLPIFKKWSLIEHYSLDHERCLELWKVGVPLITCIPGMSTHCEYGLESPFFPRNL